MAIFYFFLILIWVWIFETVCCINILAGSIGNFEDPEAFKAFIGDDDDDLETLVSQSAKKSKERDYAE